MPVVSALDILDRGAAAEPPPPVLAVVGEEEYLRLQAVEAVIGWVTETAGEPDVIRFDGAETQPRELFDEARAVGLFGGVKLLIVDDLGERGGFLDAHKDALADYVAKPADGAHLLVTAPKLNRQLRAAKAIADKHLRVDCDPPKAEPLVRWVAAQGKQLGLKLDRSAAAAMVATAGTSMATLRNELVKLDLFLGEPQGRGARVVDEALIQRVLGFDGSATIWELLDQISAGQLREALQTTDILMRHDVHAFQLVALVASQLRKYWRATGVLAEGGNPRRAASAAKVPPFKQAEFLASLSRFDLPMCRRVLADLAEVDRKDAPLPVERRFELFVMRLCAQLRPPHRSAARTAPSRGRSGA
jgi:DNA polymerase-3 subunit delta